LLPTLTIFAQHIHIQDVTAFLFCGYLYFYITLSVWNFVVQKQRTMTEKQSLAYNLYMQTGLTQQIAELTGVNRKTLYDWIKQGNWSRARTASAHAPGILLDQYYGQLIAFNNNIASRDEVFPTREDTIIMTRVNSVIKTLLPDKKSLATTIEHFTDFSEIVKDKYPELGDKLSTLIRE